MALIGALLFFSVAVFTFAKPEQEDLPVGEEALFWNCSGRNWTEKLVTISGITVTNSDQKISDFVSPGIRDSEASRLFNFLHL